MKKLWLSFLLLLPLASSAPGGVPCTLPFNLQNGTPADATQVMANYNALVACLAQAAIAGSNNDITALTALTTPISPAQGGTPVYTGGTAGGTANALTVTPVVPGGFTLQAGRVVTFVVAANNTGATTINVAGTGARTFQRRTQLGPAAMVGGELIVGEAATAYYDGTNFQLMSSAIVLIGEIKDFANVAIPAGWAALDGSCQSRTGPMAGLFVVIGITFDPTGSTCDTSSFALPDARGRVLAGVDTLGTRLTVAGSGCNGAAIGGAGCGGQNFTLAAGNIPTLNTTGVGVSFGSSSISVGVSVDSGSSTLSIAGRNTSTVGSTAEFMGTDGTSALLSQTHSFAASFNQNTLSPTVTQGSVGTASPASISNVQPTLVVNKIIKF